MYASEIYTPPVMARNPTDRKIEVKPDPNSSFPKAEEEKHAAQPVSPGLTPIHEVHQKYE